MLSSRAYNCKLNERVTKTSINSIVSILEQKFEYVKLLWKLCDYLIFDGLFRERAGATSTSKEKFAEFRQKLSLIEIVFFLHFFGKMNLNQVESTRCLLFELIAIIIDKNIQNPSWFNFKFLLIAISWL